MKLKDMVIDDLVESPYVTIKASLLCGRKEVSSVIETLKNGKVGLDRDVLIEVKYVLSNPLYDSTVRCAKARAVIDNHFGVSRRKCLVAGCTNHTDEGQFVGDLCGPCHSMITSGNIQSNGGGGWIGDAARLAKAMRKLIS
jgi:hypothetical protein